MTLAAGDLTTPQRVVTWLGGNTAANSPIIAQLISSSSALVRNCLNRSVLYSRSYSRVLNGTGTGLVALPDWPVTNIASVQLGSVAVQLQSAASCAYGYRGMLWAGDLPGEPTFLELIGGRWWRGSQNLQISYTAGYAIFNEAQVVAATAPYVVQCLMPLGICCRDISVTYAGSGVALVPVAANPSIGQYVPPIDATPGLYTFSAADEGVSVLISYSFVPADLEEACVQMVAERYEYRSRVGQLSKSLGGQETVSFMRGGGRNGNLPPEVMALLEPYINVLPPAMGISA